MLEKVDVPSLFSIFSCKSLILMQMKCSRTVAGPSREDSLYHFAISFLFSQILQNNNSNIQQSFSYFLKFYKTTYSWIPNKRGTLISGGIGNFPKINYAGR